MMYNFKTRKAVRIMADIKVGKVTHYYDKLGVAVVDLDSSLKTGDRVKFTRDGKNLLEQEVSSIQSEHKNVDEARAGKSVGLKTEQKIKEGAEGYKV